MIIHDEPQGSIEWAIRRAGIPTASEFKSLITPTGAHRKGEMLRSYVASKVAEKWQGGPLPTFYGNDMEQGELLESEALPWLSLQYGWEVQRTGLITTDDGRVGCSPDGLLLDGGLEIKCPAAHTHCKYLINGELPDDYFAQVHGCMFVTGRLWWNFVSYRRNFPDFILRVERDEKVQESIADAIDIFYGEFDLAMQRLTEINGGPPRRELSPMNSRPKPERKEPFISTMPT